MNPTMEQWSTVLDLLNRGRLAIVSPNQTLASWRALPTKYSSSEAQQRASGTKSSNLRKMIDVRHTKHQGGTSPPNQRCYVHGSEPSL